MDNEQIKKYLTNNLTAQERNAFEQEMENDPFLMEAIEGLSMVNGEWSMDAINKVEEEVNSTIDMKVHEPKKGKVISLSFFRYAAAACIIGLLGFASFKLFFVSKQLNEQAIYASYFKPLTNPDATVRGENGLTAESQAIQAYEKEDYFEAVNAYQKLVSNNPDNVKNNLFLGISFLGTNQPKKAIEVLSKLTQSEAFHFDIKWYLALAYIKNKELQQAQLLLTNLAEQENYYKNDAQEILEKLDGKIASKE